MLKMNNIKLIFGVLVYLILINNTYPQNITFQDTLEIKGVFTKISDLDLDSDGNIYVFDEGEQNIKKFSKYGEYINTIGKKGKGPGEFDTANLFEFDNNDKLIVCNFGNNRFDVLSSEGQFLSSFRVPGQSSVFALPGVSAFKINSKNHLILALHDRYSGTYLIQKWNMKGEIIHEYFRVQKELPSFNNSHREIKRELLLAIDKLDNIYYAFSDEPGITALDSIGNVKYKIDRKIIPILYSDEERKKLIEETKKIYIEGFTAGYMNGAKNIPKNIPLPPWAKDTYKYKPFSFALFSLKGNQVVVVSASINKTSNVDFEFFEDGISKNVQELELYSINSIFNAFSEKLLINNNVLLQVVEDEDEIQNVMKYSGLW